jgi:hypothetical protein
MVAEGPPVQDNLDSIGQIHDQHRDELMSM